MDQRGLKLREAWQRPALDPHPALRTCRSAVA